MVAWKMKTGTYDYLPAHHFFTSLFLLTLERPQSRLHHQLSNIFPHDCKLWITALWFKLNAPRVKINQHAVYMAHLVQNFPLRHRQVYTQDWFLYLDHWVDSKKWPNLLWLHIQFIVSSFISSTWLHFCQNRISVLRSKLRCAEIATARVKLI